MLARLRSSGKKIALSAIAGLALILGASSTLFVSAARHTPAASKSSQLVGHLGTGIVRSGEVNFAKLPIATASEVAASAALYKPGVMNRSPKTAAQVAAYTQWSKTHASALPHSNGTTAAPVGPRSPDFLTQGGLTVPQLVNQGAGIDFTTPTSCGCAPPDQAVGVAPGYVFEGVNNLLKVYSWTYGTVSGPVTPQAFFSPLYHGGDFFSDPQITFDAERARWVISWLEITPNGCGAGCDTDYIDLAISKGTGPSPLVNTNFLEYQISAQVVAANNLCDYETLGYDYFGLWISCIDFNVGGLGNTTFIFGLNAMIAGSLGTHYAWYNNIPTDLAGNPPAFRLSPVTEDGAPNAEFEVATDAGYGVLSSTINLCAFTNTAAINSSVAPLGSCIFTAVPAAYDDALAMIQPSGTMDFHAINYGTKQIAYRAGKIYFALNIEITCGSSAVEDGIAWYDVTPQLDTSNPQFVNGVVGAYSEAGYLCYNIGAGVRDDTYDATLIPSTEGDSALVYNYSNATVSPSIVWTGRQPYDAPGTMGHGAPVGASFYVLIGGFDNATTRWGDYSACALTTNLVSRGIVFCGSEYVPNNTGDVWGTELYQLRME